MGRENSVSEALGSWFASVMGPESVAERITAKGSYALSVVPTCKVTLAAMVSWHSCPRCLSDSLFGVFS